MLSFPHGGIAKQTTASRLNRLHHRVLLTAYHGPCRRCHTGRLTRSGRRAQTEGIACPPRFYRRHARVRVLGRLLPCDDTGGAIQGWHFDLRVATHAQAERFGVKRVPATLLWGR
jgi:3D (Asp-Asp-Asp) domain-containing protein